jgi:hypothetical protein
MCTIEEIAGESMQDDFDSLAYRRLYLSFFKYLMQLTNRTLKKKKHLSFDF